MNRLSPGKLAQKYPPLPQLPRQHRQGSRTQVTLFMARGDLLREAPYLKAPYFPYFRDSSLRVICIFWRRNKIQIWHVVVKVPQEFNGKITLQSSSSSQQFPTANLQKTQQLLNESTYLQSQLQNSQLSTIQPSSQINQVGAEVKITE